LKNSMISNQEKTVGHQNPETNHVSGCMVCGGAIVCTPNTPLRAKCFYCGKEEITHVFCMEGHYVCDDCHRKDILDAIAEACIASNLTDPITLAQHIFELPGLHMHGPEYHCIVPAVLMAVYGNLTNAPDPNLIREAIKRGKDIPGGACGIHGACGAGIGVGIAYSLMHKVTPFSKADRGIANRVTSLALLEISGFEGPRCCKRDAMAAISVAKKYFACFHDVPKTYYECTQYIDNTMCIKEKCPYYPGVTK
jgi:hypothetical protein